MDDVATRIARHALARRGTTYEEEVRRLLDAGLTVMGRCGTGARPRVADIVAEAGVSNEAFYRYFPSKDALVAAILEDGTQRLVGYLTHQMAKEATPEAEVRRFVRGVMAQADEGVAETTVAVLFNAGGIADGRASGRHPASGALASLLHAPFDELGSREPALDAELVTHGLLGRLADHLWRSTRPTRAEVEHLARAVVAVAASGRPG